ncbi:multicopper oxidase domain-containing protein [Streptomyces niveus]|uniref:multicopper oxidase domain-containing protein n=1 Tax=Streptomyces niveus TaxID=193462 RepID=UPI0036377213
MGPAFRESSHAYRPARRGKLIGARSWLARSPRARWLSADSAYCRGNGIDLRQILGDIAVIQQRTSRSQKFDMFFHCHNLEHEDMAMMANFEVR